LAGGVGGFTGAVARAGPPPPAPPPSPAAATAAEGARPPPPPVPGAVRGVALAAMGWLPAGPPAARAPRGGDGGGRPLAACFLEGDGVGMPSLQHGMERRVCVLTLMDDMAEAAALLARYGAFHPLYPSLALELTAAAAAAARRRQWPPP